jgi:hypothetical protein
MWHTTTTVTCMCTRDPGVSNYCNTLSGLWSSELVHCTLQTITLELKIVHVSGKNTCGEDHVRVQHHDESWWIRSRWFCVSSVAFSGTIPLHVWSCVLDPCPCFSSHCLVAALPPCVVLPCVRAPCFRLTLLYPRVWPSSHSSVPLPTTWLLLSTHVQNVRTCTYTRTSVDCRGEKWNS